MFTPTLRCECAQPGLIDTIWEWSIPLLEWIWHNCEGRVKMRPLFQFATYYLCEYKRWVWNAGECCRDAVWHPIHLEVESSCKGFFWRNLLKLLDTTSNKFRCSPVKSQWFLRGYCTPNQKLPCFVLLSQNCHHPFQKIIYSSRAVASLSLSGGQDKKISSIFPHFPVVSLIFPHMFLIFFFILVFRVGGSHTREGPCYATVSILQFPLKTTIVIDFVYWNKYN